MSDYRFDAHKSQGNFHIHIDKELKVTKSGLLMHRWEVQFGKNKTVSVVTRAKTREQAIEMIFAMGELYSKMDAKKFDAAVNEDLSRHKWYTVVIKPTGKPKNPSHVTMSSCDPATGERKYVFDRDIPYKEVERLKGLAKMRFRQATGTKGAPSLSGQKQIARRGGHFAALLDELEKTSNRNKGVVKRELNALSKSYPALFEKCKEGFGGDEDKMADSLTTPNLITLIHGDYIEKLPRDKYNQADAIAAKLIRDPDHPDARESVGAFDLAYREVTGASPAPLPKDRKGKGRAAPPPTDYPPLPIPPSSIGDNGGGPSHLPGPDTPFPGFPSGNDDEAGSSGT